MSNTGSNMAVRYFGAKSEEERSRINEDAIATLDEDDLIAYQSTIENAARLPPPVARSRGSSSGKNTVKGQAVLGGDQDAEIRALWVTIDNLDMTKLIDQDVIDAFSYSGFNPDAILRALLGKKKAGSVADEEFKKDIATMVLISIMKGSVTEKNLTKMSDGGKKRYTDLESRYGLVKGGAKGKPADIITISRIAATFPGLVLQVVSKFPSTARVFTGPFKTNRLPSYMRHQALAACIPQSLADDTKYFLLDLVTAFSVDQTKTISKTKTANVDLFEAQKAFTTTAHGGAYPPEKVRKAIFRSLPWSQDYAKIKEVSDSVKKIVTDLSQVNLDVFNSAIAGLG